jgi:quercetin dioxygenase-like cupin family protein
MNTPAATVMVNVGAVRGPIYDFTEVGDGLPMHVHDEATAHITIVARGAITANGTVCHAGRVLAFPAGYPHEIVAIEPNTRIINFLTAAP